MTCLFHEATFKWRLSWKLLPRLKDDKDWLIIWRLSCSEHWIFSLYLSKYYFYLYGFSRDVYSLHGKLNDRCFCYFPAAIFVFLVQRAANMMSPYNCRALYTDMGNTVNQNICHAKFLSDMNLGKNVCRFISFHLLRIELFWLYFLTACLWKIHFPASLHTG